jgi:hypothetical protein
MPCRPRKQRTRRLNACFSSFLCTAQLLDMPELLWKSYIDFEIANSETEKARMLYERLLERTAHVKVCLHVSCVSAPAAIAGLR